MRAPRRAAGRSRAPGRRTSLLLLAAAVGVAAAGCGPFEGDRGAAHAQAVGGRAGAPPFPARGSRAPDFLLPPLLLDAPWVGTDSVRLSDLRGRWVYLDVFGSWCLPCRQRHPEMLRVAHELRAQGAEVLGLLLEDRPETAARWLAEHGAGYPFLVLDDRTARSWGLTGAPMGFLISPEGRVERACHGCSHGEHAIEGLPAEVRRLRGRS